MICTLFILFLMFFVCMYGKYLAVQREAKNWRSVQKHFLHRLVASDSVKPLQHILECCRNFISALTVAYISSISWPYVSTVQYVITVGLVFLLHFL